MKRSKKASGGQHFAMLPVPLMYHPAVTTLSYPSRWVMALLAGQYRGKNNGALGITFKQAQAAGIASKHTLYDALRELTMRGLISVTYPSSRTPPRPTMYALGWWPVDDTPYSIATKTAAHGYRDWRPEKQKRGCTPCTQRGARHAPMEIASG